MSFRQPDLHFARSLRKLSIHQLTKRIRRTAALVGRLNRDNPDLDKPPGPAHLEAILQFRALSAEYRHRTTIGARVDAQMAAERLAAQRLAEATDWDNEDDLL